MIQVVGHGKSLHVQYNKVAASSGALVSVVLYLIFFTPIITDRVILALTYTCAEKLINQFTFQAQVSYAPLICISVY